MWIALAEKKEIVYKSKYTSKKTKLFIKNAQQ